MKRFAEGFDRDQSSLFPETLDDVVEQDNPGGVNIEENQGEGNRN